MQTAAVLFLFASGLTLVLGVLSIPNLAHASFCVMGAYVGWSTVSVLHGMGVPGAFWFALVVAPVTVMLVAGVIEALFFRRLYPREMFYQILFAYALLLVFSDAMRLLWGADVRSIVPPAGLDTAISIGGQHIPLFSLFLIAVSFAVMLLLWVILQRTRFGRLIRATAQDREAAGLVGINVSSITTGVMMLGTAFGAVGGVLLATLGSVSTGVEFSMTVETFIVVIVGGFGSVGGAFLAATIIGLAESFSTLLIPHFGITVKYFIMILILLLRPWGLLGQSER